MRSRASSLGLPALGLVAVLSVPASGAGKLDKASERWLKEVHLLILPEEEALYRDLPSPDDRREFEKIFWARRDPDPSTPVNELEEAMRKARRRADDLYTIPGGEPGHLTGCGQVLVLLGEPLEREGREARARFDAARTMREGALRPETWTYKSREGDPVEFTGGELRISFDDACRFAEGGRVLEDLRRVAASYVVRPQLDYRKGKDGHLVKLDALRSGGGGAGSIRTLLESDRADFPLEVEPHMLMRTPTGEAYAAGLVRAPGGLPPDPVRVAAAVQGDAGKAAEIQARPATVGDAAVLSWGLILPPGRQTVRVAVEAGASGAVVPITLDVPDFKAPGLHLSSLLVFPEESAPATPDDEDPYAALRVGSLHVRPRFGNVFTPEDQLNVVAAIYGGTVDSASGKASLRVRYCFIKDGRTVAKGDEQAYETPTAVASVGPVPLASFAPGRYVVRLEVHDGPEGAPTTEETAFEIRK